MLVVQLALTCFLLRCNLKFPLLQVYPLEELCSLSFGLSKATIQARLLLMLSRKLPQYQVSERLLAQLSSPVRSLYLD